MPVVAFLSREEEEAEPAGPDTTAVDQATATPGFRRLAARAVQACTLASQAHGRATVEAAVAHQTTQTLHRMALQLRAAGEVSFTTAVIQTS